MTRQEALQIAKPILFNTDMARAILDGRKTVTRRPIKPQPANKDDIIYKHDECGKCFISPDDDSYPETKVKMPYKVGDILYVRETWHNIGPSSARDYVYKADDPLGADKWCPSIHMPKEVARIFLRVTDVRVERLQDITINGLQEEGILNDGYISQYASMTTTAFEDFKDLWNNTVKKSDFDKYGWEANPWVWVIEFERLDVK